MKAINKFFPVRLFLKISLLILFGCCFLKLTCESQTFSFECKHQKNFLPYAEYFRPEKNVYQELFYENRIPFKKITDTTSILTLKPTVVSFMQVMGDEIIISPKDTSKAYQSENMVHLIMTDTSSPNYLFRKLDSGVLKNKV